MRKKLTRAAIAGALLTSVIAVTTPSAQAAGSPFAAPRANPYPVAATRAPNATSRTAFAAAEIARLTGERDCWVGAYRPYERATTNHNTGNALDCTISPRIGLYPNTAMRYRGWEIATWLRNNAARLQIRYIIWDGDIWHASWGSPTWRAYTTAKGVTGGHHDHIHISFHNPYGD